MEDGKLKDLELKLVYFGHISFKQKVTYDRDKETSVDKTHHRQKWDEESNLKRRPKGKMDI